MIVSRQYDTFGNIQSGTTSGFAFTGRYWDSETGLYNYRARYYDPRAGTFLSQDPIGFWGGANFYAYVRNNPVNWTDPLGLAPQGRTCCAKDEERIRQQMQNARNRIESLVKTGTAVLSEGGNVPCATTNCIVYRIPGTNIITVAAETDYQPACSNLSPCIKHCVDMHEAVHRRMCKRLGLKFLTLSEYQAEYPAYMTELGCYIRTLREGGVNPYPD